MADLLNAIAISLCVNGLKIKGMEEVANIKNPLSPQ